ncbi:MAG: hypothetical protein HFG80_04270 [Eubacterium sp.]|nr:hypothetical protein [Eubacterium sp.]
MLWNIIILIGALFIVNGIVSTCHTRVVEKVRKQMPEQTEIYCGGAKGLLFITSTDVMLAVKKNGCIAKAFCIKSGWLRKSKAEELAIEGWNMNRLRNEIPSLQEKQQKACRMAFRHYEWSKRKQRVA